MKSSQFKRQGAAIRFRRETAKKSFPWGKLVYLTIFYGLLAWGALFLGYWLLIIDRAGEIRFPDINVTVLESGILKRTMVKEGDLVKKGDLLFEMEYERAPREIERTWLQREKWNLEQEKFSTELRLKNLHHRLKMRREELVRLEESSLLELRDPSQMIILQRDLQDVEQNIAMERENLEGIKKQKARIDQMPIIQVQEPFKPSKIFYAPMDGTITRIDKDPGQAIFPSERVLKINRQEEITIRAYFDQKDIKYLQVGDNVQVIWPSGQKTTGKVRRFFFSTFPLPPEFQPRFEPQQRSITVEIDPGFKDSAQVQNTYYKMGVRIRKSRWRLPWLSY